MPGKNTSAEKRACIYTSIKVQKLANFVKRKRLSTVVFAATGGGQ